MELRTPFTRSCTEILLELSVVVVLYIGNKSEVCPIISVVKPVVTVVGDKLFCLMVDGPLGAVSGII